MYSYLLVCVICVMLWIRLSVSAASQTNYKCQGMRAVTYVDMSKTGNAIPAKPALRHAGWCYVRTYV